MRIIPSLALMLGVALCSALTIRAEAQLSAYATVDYTSFDLVTPGTVYIAKHGGGLGAGAFYNFPLQSRLTAGADLRLNYSPAFSGGNAGALSFRLGFVPHQFPLRPYFQIGGGLVSSSFRTSDVNAATGTFSSSTNTRLTSGTFDIMAGLDIRLTDTLDLRALELGVAAGSSRPDGVGLAYLNAGLVYHFHPH